MSLFPSFFLGGFECSTHRRRDGRRLDPIAGTGHDRHAAADYARLRDAGDVRRLDPAARHMGQITDHSREDAKRGT